MSMPTDLPPSDNLQAIVDSAALPLRPCDRPLFFASVGAELSRHPEVGPGSVFRVCREVQKRYFDPPAQSYRGPRAGL